MFHGVIQKITLAHIYFSETRCNAVLVERGTMAHCESTTLLPRIVTPGPIQTIIQLCEIGFLLRLFGYACSVIYTRDVLYLHCSRVIVTMSLS